MMWCICVYNHRPKTRKCEARVNFCVLGLRLLYRYQFESIYVNRSLSNFCQSPFGARAGAFVRRAILRSGLLLRIVEPERFTIGLDRAEVAQN